jgi:hypothetical protein
MRPTRVRPPAGTPVRKVVTGAGLLALGIAVTAGVATVAGAVHEARRGDEPGGGVRLLEAEIESMEAGGVAPDDPKLQLLEDDLAALERGQRTVPPREPDVDVGAVLGDPATALRDATDQVGDAGDNGNTGDAGDRGLRDDGAVACEVVPPDLLTAADIAGATCTSTVDADGGSRYAAVAPDGTVRTVRFAPDGSVTREPDRQQP